MTLASSTVLTTKLGNFTVSYHDFGERNCVTLRQGDISIGTPLLRIHSSCIFSETFGSIDCDCALQLEEAMKAINEVGHGVIAYLYQEGRGHGLANKIKSMDIERTKGVDTVQAFESLNFDLDPRDYVYALMALKELNLSQDIKIMCNNYRKIDAVKNAGYNIVEQIQLEYPTNNYVKQYLSTKKGKLGHNIKSSLIG